MKTSLFITIIIFLTLGIFIGYIIPHNGTSSLPNILTSENTADLKTGLLTAYDRLILRGHADIAFSGFGFRESKSIGGIINNINGNSITLQVTPINALADPALDVRNIKLGPNTKLYKLVPKSGSEITKDMADFSKTINGKLKSVSGADSSTLNSEPFSILPSPMKKVEITIGDLIKGKNIMIVSSTNNQDMKNIDALEISITD